MLQIPGTATLSTPYDFQAGQNNTPLGTELHEFTGRKWRYGLNGATLGVTGSISQSPVPDANLDLLVTAAAAVGARSVTITLGATALTADQFNGGFVVIEDDAGEGFCYLIEDTPAISATTAGAISLAHGIEVALTAASTTGIIRHPGQDLIEHLSPPTAMTYGMCAAPITAANFGWYQFRGFAAVEIEGTVRIGERVRLSEGTDGAVTPLDFDEATQADFGDVGQVIEVGVTTEHGTVWLSIP
jgi:hypothetical protein